MVLKVKASLSAQSDARNNHAAHEIATRAANLCRIVPDANTTIQAIRILANKIAMRFCITDVFDTNGVLEKRGQFQFPGKNKTAALLSERGGL